MRLHVKDRIALGRKSLALPARSGLVAGKVGLLVVALGVNLFLTMAILDRPYARMLLSPILPLSVELTMRLDALPPAEEKAGTQALLQEWQDRLRERLSFGDLALRDDRSKPQDNVQVSLVTRTGNILFTTDPDLVGKSIGAELLEKAAMSLRRDRSDQTREWLEQKALTRIRGQYCVVLPYRSGQGNSSRILVVKLPRAPLTLNAAHLFVTHYKVALGILVLGAAVLILGLGFGWGTIAETGSDSPRASLFVIYAVIAFQLAATGCLVGGFAKDYLTGARANAEFLLTRCASTIVEERSASPQFSGMSKPERFLSDVSQAIPELEDAFLTDPRGRRVGVAQSGKGAAGGWNFRFVRSLLSLAGTRDLLTVRVPIDGRKAAGGFLVAKLSPALVMKRVLEGVFDGLTAILVSVLLFAELRILLRHRVGARIRTAEENAATAYVLVRPAAFFYVFSIDLSMSFLPLHMERLYEPLLGLPKSVVIGLPLSVEFLCVGVAILAAGAWYDRRGWHEPLLVGLGLASLGGLCSWLAQGALSFILSRGLLGFGYGLALMASQGFVIGHTDSRNKAQGLAHLFAGLYAGSICGAAAGGILAERYGYRAAFLIGAVTIALIIPYTLAFMGRAMRPTSPQVKRPHIPKAGPRRLTRFLCNRSVLALTLLSSLPASIAVVGFLNYFSPLYLQQLGASEATIGKVLVIYGSCLIFLGPTMGKYADSFESKRTVIFVGGLLGSAAFLAFNALSGVMAAVWGVLLLGLSHSLVLSSQSAYMLQLEVTRELGEGTAMGIFRSSSRFGQMLGPMVFSGVAMSGSLRGSLMFFGVAYLLVALLFLFATRQDRGLLAREYT